MCQFRDRVISVDELLAKATAYGMEAFAAVMFIRALIRRLSR